MCSSDLNIADGASYELWSVNVEEEYHEEVRSSESKGATGDRMLPGAVQVEGIGRKKTISVDWKALEQHLQTA